MTRPIGMMRGGRTVPSAVRRGMAGVIGMALLAGVAMAATPLATAAQSKTLIVRDLPAQVRLVPGERVQLILSTNRTTGYTWVAQGGCCDSQNRPIVRVSRGVYTAPAASNGMVGVAGTTTWTIRALRAGSTTVTVVTRPPGAQNTMSDEEVGTLSIIVMPG
ncbi:MAG: protease inhibitor I42 family protein [Actinomycetales bacterium]